MLSQIEKIKTLMYCVDNDIVNQDSSAIFANNYFFMHPDIQLVLRRDFIKTTSTGIPFQSAQRQVHCGHFS